MKIFVKDFKEFLNFKNCIIIFLMLCVYYTFYQGFYNMVAFGELYPYISVANCLKNIGFNFIPILSLFILDSLWILSFSIPSVTAKLVIDGMVSVLNLIVFNVVYSSVLLYTGAVNHAGIDWAGTAFNTVLMYMALEVAFYIRRFQIQLYETERQKLKALQYEYEALKSQVNPHFLFNSLNILYAMLPRDLRSAREFVTTLSSIYRHIVKNYGKDTVMLSDELEFVHSYVSILKYRYNDWFEMEISHNDDFHDKRLIPFTLQLLIENVCKHNVISSKCKMKVNVEINSDCIVISNAIKAKHNVEESGFGLNYLKDIYESYGKVLSYDNKDDIFQVHVPFLN